MGTPYDLDRGPEDATAEGLSINSALAQLFIAHIHEWQRLQSQYATGIAFITAVDAAFTLEKRVRGDMLAALRAARASRDWAAEAADLCLDRINTITNRLPKKRSGKGFWLGDDVILSDMPELYKHLEGRRARITAILAVPRPLPATVGVFIPHTGILYWANAQTVRAWKRRWEEGQGIQHSLR